MSIIRRSHKVDLSVSDVSNWNKRSKFLTHFLNGLSAYFPPGERFFIDAARHYRKDVEHIEWLHKNLLGFIGQEVSHGQMHDLYDKALVDAGFPADKLEQFVKVALDFIHKNASPKFQLGLTVAAEHYTATMANYLLSSDILENADEAYAVLWKTHAIEEIEHRSVTFDIHEMVGSYPNRMVTYFLASLILMPVFVITQIGYIIKDKSVSVFDLTEWTKFIRIFSEMLYDMYPEMIKFCSPGYHPDEMKICRQYETTKLKLGLSEV